MRQRQPRVIRFIVTGAILGAAVLGLISVLQPEAPGYSESSSVGFMLVVGAAIGAIVALVGLALVVGKPEKKAPIKPAPEKPIKPAPEEKRQDPRV